MIAYPPFVSEVTPPRTPTLTPKQQRFYADPSGCMEALQERADCLFENGYLAIAAAIPLVFVVRHKARGKHRSDDEICYYVHAIKRTCSCPFFTRQRVEPLTENGDVVPCKHVLGLEKLVRRSVNHFKRTGDLYRYLRLLSQWMAVLAEQALRGITPLYAFAESVCTDTAEMVPSSDTATTTVTAMTAMTALPSEVQKGN